MVLQAISSRLLVQADPQATLSWYRDDDVLQPGDLAVWIDRAGQLVRFSLAYTPDVLADELFAAWENGRSVRTGVVEREQRARLGHPRSRLIRRRSLATSELAILRGYLAANASVAPAAPEVISILDSVT